MDDVSFSLSQIKKTYPRLRVKKGLSLNINTRLYELLLYGKKYITDKDFPLPIFVLTWL